MNNTVENVLNGTNVENGLDSNIQCEDSFEDNLGQYRLVETENAINIKYLVTDSEKLLNEYSKFAVKTAQSTVEMCRVVYEAKTSLSNSEYSWFLSSIGHKSENSTIRKYLAIGENYDKLIQYANLLPNSWTSIYKLTQLSPDLFEAYALIDTDFSKMSGKAIQSLIDSSKSRQNDDNSIIDTDNSNETVNSESASSHASSANLRIDNQIASTSFQSTSSNSDFSSSNNIPTDLEHDDEEDEDDEILNSSVQSDSDDDLKEKIETTIDIDSDDPLNAEEKKWINECNKTINQESDLYAVMIVFNSVPSNDIWFDLTESVKNVIESKSLNAEMRSARPLFKVKS